MSRVTILRIAKGVPSLPFDESGSFTPPPAFGPYRVLHQIGSGVLGPVFRTYDPQADKLVAVKVFRLDLLPEDVARLADGLRRLAGAHGNLAAGLEGTSAYLAIDYLGGETLDVALRHLAPAPLETALPLIAACAKLIDEAWAGGPMFGHGALHPRDIFVTPGTNEVAITGFGVLPALEAIGAKPTIRRPYTAPERVAGDPWDIRADIYSLAAVAHELLTGRRPAGPSEQDGSLLATIPPETRAHVRRVLSKALAESPAQRFATAAEFVAALGKPSVSETAASASAFAEATASASADKPADKPAQPAPLTLLPEPESRDEFDLSHVIKQDAEPPAAPAPGVAPPTPTRHVKSRTVAMPVAKPAEPKETAPVEIPLAAAEPRFRTEPDVHLTRTALPDFTMPPPFPWAAMVVVLIAGLVLGAAGMYQYLSPRLARAASAAAPAAIPPAAAKETPKTGAPGPAKDASRGDTEVAVTQPPAPPKTEAPKSEAPKAAPLPGRITIHSTPSGAAVSIDGKPAGKTPLAAADLPLGAHSVVISHPGYAADTRRVTLSRRVPSAAMAVTLKAERRAAGPAAATGSVAVDSRPRGARITIDGKTLGQTPMSVPGLAPGSHALRLELNGYKPLVTSVTVKAGDTARVAVTLEIR